MRKAAMKPAPMTIIQLPPRAGLLVLAVTLIAACGVEDKHGGNAECPNGCGSNQICVSGWGCEPVCSANSQCSTGCCVTMTNGNKACGPASYCGGGGTSSGGTSSGGSSGGGSSCTSANQCIKMVKQLGDAGYCRTTGGGTHDFLPVLQNTCGSAVYCEICGTGADTHCTTWDFSPGQSLGGWATSFTWCDTTTINVRCASGANRMRCVD